MNRALHPRLAVYLAAAAVALLGGAALGRPALMAAGAPFVLFVLGALLADRAPMIAVSLDVDRGRVVEGEPVVMKAHVRPAHAVELVVTPLLPRGFGQPATVATRLRAGQTWTLELPLSPQRWGGYALGPVQIVAAGTGRLVSYTQRLGDPVPLRVYPRPETLTRALAPRLTRPAPGALSSRALGEGLEYDGVRALTPGEPVRRVNWRATARTGRLYATQRRLERSADVVLLLDTFATVGSHGDGTHEQAVRAADALAARHLARGDRVGVVAFGGVAQWLDPAGGRRARLRIVETLIESEIVFSYAWKDVRILPRRSLPAHALVIGVTPLLDERGVRALLDLVGRGFDVAALVIPPFPFVRPESPAADRLWRLRHDALRRQLGDARIATAAWELGSPLAEAVTELELCRRAG